VLLFITRRRIFICGCEFLFGTICVNCTFLVSDFKKLKVGWIPTFIGKRQLYREYYVHVTGKFLFDLQNLELDFGTTYWVCK
jgi:hypothetical protein